MRLRRGSCSLNHAVDGRVGLDSHELYPGMSGRENPEDLVSKCLANAFDFGEIEDHGLEALDSCEEAFRL